MNRRNKLPIIVAAAAVLVLIPAAYAQECVPPPDGLVSWWPGDGDAEDIVSGHSGLILGGMGFDEGMVDQAFSLDDVDDGVEIPKTDGVFDLVDEWTVDAWVFPFAPGWDQRNDPIVWKTGNGNRDTFWIGWGCNTCPDDPSRFVTGLEQASDDRDFITTSEPHPPGVWYHVAGVYDGTDLIIYVNGFEEERNTIGSIIAYTTPDPLTIGNIVHSSHGNAGVFDGLIDEVEVFDRALIAEEIAAIYVAGSAGNCKLNPAEVVMGILEDIIIENPGTPLADKLADALASVETALEELNKEPPDNQAAVGNLEGAVGSICDAVLDEGLDAAQGTQLMDDLAGVAMQLAVDAIDAAIAQGGDPQVIQVAQDALDDGDMLRALGNGGDCLAFKDTVNAYKDALAKADS